MRIRTLTAALAGIAGVLPALAAGGGHDAPMGISLVKPEWGLIVWTTVTFVLLAYGLSRVAWKPLLGAIQAREQSIADSLDSAKRDREEAAKTLEEHRRLVAQAHKDRADALDHTQKEAERLKDEILAEARTQKNHILQQTQDQVRASVEQARNELRSLTVDLALQAAGKLLDRNVDDATQRKLVEDHLTDLERKGASGPSGLPS